MERKESGRALVILSFAAIYFIWGSTYLINYFAIQTIPPFLMSGTRFLTAGILLFGLATALGQALPANRHWVSTWRMGMLFLTLGTGGTVWAEQYVDTGIAALLIAFQPLLIVGLMWLLYGKRPGPLVVAGIGLGVIGMAVLVSQQRLVTDNDTLLGMLVIAFSMTCWGIASVTLPKADLPSNRMQSTAMQMIGGGASLILISLLSGEAKTLDLAQITLKAGLSWLYLVFFGSILAFSAFTFLLHKVTPDKVATANYVNPVVALFLGWAFNQERITVQSIIAAALMLTGVFFINVTFLSRPTPNTPPPPQSPQPSPQT